MDDKNKSDKSEPKKVVMRLKGMIDVIACKGKSLPFYMSPGKRCVIAEKKYVSINMDGIPYSSKNIIKRALRDKDIQLYVKPRKGGK